MYETHLISFSLLPVFHSYWGVFGEIKRVKSVKSTLKNALKVEFSTLINDLRKNNLTRHLKLLLLKFLPIIY